MSNIKIVSDAYLCSNCGACNAVCAKQAIEFKWTNIGRKYAFVNANCVDCGLCTQVCPSLNSTECYHFKKPDNAYIARAINQSVYHNSQSGGVATALLKYCFDNNKIDGAVVCRMDFGETPDVNAVVVYSAEELLACQKSCYTPVDLLSIFKDLDKSKRLAIVGLPCHLAGLALLQNKTKRYLNVCFSIGLICDRTLCAGIQDVFASYSDKKSIKIRWRKKDFSKDGKYYPYQSAPVVIEDETGNELIFPNHYRFALKDMFTTPRCQICTDKLNCYAEIMVGDPWDMDGADLDHGDSVVVAYSEKGKEILDAAVVSGAISIGVTHTYEKVEFGQQVTNRIKKSMQFRKAMESFADAPKFYVLQNTEEQTCESAVNVIKDFIEVDKASKEEIIQLGRDKIYKVERVKRFNSNPVLRLLLKISNILHI